MSFIIGKKCVSTCDTACVDVCPVDCIHGPIDIDGGGAEVEKLRELSHFFGSSLRYLQFGNGSLVSAHGGCLGNYNQYVKLLGEIINCKEDDKVCDLGFKRLDGARMSIIIDASPPLYGKRDL